MTIAEIRKRVLRIIDREDSEAADLIDEWIVEVIRTVEDAYPLPYTKKPYKIALTANQGVYTLPVGLILHHPYIFKVESISAPNVFKPLVKIGQDTYDLNFLDTAATSEVPDYYHLTGGADGLEFSLSRVPLIEQDLHISGGHFYSPTADWDGSCQNWLTDNRPKLLIRGVAAEAFQFYEEPTRAQEQFALYQAELNGDRTRGIPGLIPDTKRTSWNRRPLRVRLAYDSPNAVKL